MIRKLILVLFILLSCASLANAGGIISFPGGGVPSGVDYSYIILWINAEGAISGTYNIDGSECANDTTGTINGELTIDAVTPLVGAGSFVTAGTYDHVLFSMATTAMPEGRIGIMVDPISEPIDNGVIFDLRHSANNDRIILRYDGTDDVQFIIIENDIQIATLSTAANNYDTDTLMIEVAWKSDIGDGSDTMEIFADGVSIVSLSNETLDEALGYDGFYIGNLSAVANTIRMDQIIISNDSTKSLNALKALLSAPVGACP